MLGSGSGKKATVAQRKAAGGLNPGLDPSQMGPADLVAQRNATAAQGKMLKDQLKKNKSA